MVDDLVHTQSSSKGCTSVYPSSAPVTAPNLYGLVLDTQLGTSAVDSNTVHRTDLLDILAPWQPPISPGCSAIESASSTEGHMVRTWPSGSNQDLLDSDIAAALSLLPTSDAAQVCPVEGWDGCDDLASIDFDRFFDGVNDSETDSPHSAVSSLPEEQPQRGVRSQELQSAEHLRWRSVCADLHEAAVPGVQSAEKRVEGPAALGSSG